MAVAKVQVRGVYDVICIHVPRERIGRLLTDLATTSAYANNASFRETVDRLDALHREETRQ